MGIQRIENAMLRQLSNSDNPGDLMSISKVYEQEAVERKRAGQRYRGYELIKEVAEFTARVQDLANRRADETTRRRASQQSTAFLLSTFFLDVEEYRFDFSEPKISTLTLATVDRLNALRYIVSTAETVTW